MANFDSIKKKLIEDISGGVDFSPKGNIDVPIRPLVNFINNCSDYVTTSSCSGRICVFESNSQRKGIQWLLVEHGVVTLEDLISVVKLQTEDSGSLLMVKCEPFILHVLCRNVEAARELHQLAYSCGYRESGLTIGQKKIMVAVRTTAFIMELPYALSGRLMISPFDLKLIVKELNSRLTRNFSRVDRFLLALKNHWSWPRLQCEVIAEANNKATSSTTINYIDQQLLSRWGHCSVLSKLDHVVTTVGGEGSCGQQRQTRHVTPCQLELNTPDNTVIARAVPLFDTRQAVGIDDNEKDSVSSVEAVHAASCMWQSVIEAPNPNNLNVVQSPSVGIIAEFLVLTGGRLSPTSPSPMLRIIEVPSNSNSVCNITINVMEVGNGPSPRWGHSLTRITVNEYVLFGGRDENAIHNDGYLLTLSIVSQDFVDGKLAMCIQGQWQKIVNQQITNTTGSENVETFRSRVFHAAVAVNAKTTSISHWDPNYSISNSNAESDPNAALVEKLTSMTESFDSVLVHGGLSCLSDPSNHGDFQLISFPEKRIASDELIIVSVVSVPVFVQSNETASNKHKKINSAELLSLDSTDVIHSSDHDPDTVHSAFHVVSLPRFGHSLTNIGAKCLLLIGGTSFENDTSITNIDLAGRSTNIVIDLFLNESGELNGCCRPISVVENNATVSTTDHHQHQSHAHLPCEDCRVHHTATFVVDDKSVVGRNNGPTVSRESIYLLGGGAACLSFGPHYCASLLLTIKAITSIENKHSNVGSHSAVESENKKFTHVVAPTGVAATGSAAASVLLVPKDKVKTVKLLLEKENYLDKSFRITETSAEVRESAYVVQLTEIDNSSTAITAPQSTQSKSNYMSVPISAVLAAFIERVHQNLQSLGDPLNKETTFLTSLSAALGSSSVLVGKQSVRLNKTTTVSGIHKARDYLEDFVNSHFASQSEQIKARKNLPSKFELVGDILMIPEDALNDDVWRAWQPWVLPANYSKTLDEREFVGQVNNPALGFWEGLAACVGASRVARKSRIDSGPKRESRILLLLPPLGRPETTGIGSPGWVTVQENGIRFNFDITRVMFCSGNVTERMRMSREHCEGQVVVDLYCGVGYYSIPFLLYGHAAHLHACEWNPNSVLSLRVNLEQAKIDPSRYTIHAGDNQQTTAGLHNIADRISLGLLPSSVTGWPLAVKILKPTGGRMHVHENVHEDIMNTWIEDMVTEFTKQFAEAGKPMKLEVLHVEKVKSYAPRVYHIVVDVQCTQII